MKRTLRKNITDIPYGLHDMHLTGLTAKENELIFHFANGFEQNIIDGEQVKGEIRFHEVDWDFCFAYVLDFCGNEGSFTGRKYMFEDFVKEKGILDFEIIDETYGYNSSKFAGWLWEGNSAKECYLELYHIGAMEYITDEQPCEAMQKKVRTD